MFFCSLAITKIQLFIEKLLFLPYYFGVGNFRTIIIGCFNVILSIEEIDLSQYDKLKKIEKDTFWACNALKKVKLPDRITAIEDGAFFGYRCLKEINIPNKVTSIEETAFQYCEALGEKVLSQYDKFKKIKQEKRKKKDTLEKKVKEEKKS